MTGVVSVIRFSDWAISGFSNKVETPSQVCHVKYKIVTYYGHKLMPGVPSPNYGCKFSKASTINYPAEVQTVGGIVFHWTRIACNQLSELKFACGPILHLIILFFQKLNHHGTTVRLSYVIF